MRRCVLYLFDWYSVFLHIFTLPGYFPPHLPNLETTRLFLSEKQITKFGKLFHDEKKKYMLFFLAE
jgi:hypothetical protein